MNTNAVAHQVRALLIVDGFSRTALYPVPLDAIHAAGYFVDVFAGMWNARTLNASVLKQRTVPRSRALQSAVDRLVGHAVLIPSAVRYARTGASARLDATYAANLELASSILEALRSDDFWRAERNLVGEVTLAMSGFAGERMSRTVAVDATYSDPLLDVNTLVDLGSDPGVLSKTEAASNQIAAIGLAEFGRDLGVAELTALYLRHIYPFTELSA